MAINEELKQITVRLHCFSHLKYVLGTAELHLNLNEGTSVAELITKVRNLAPGKLDEIPLRAALNKQFVEDSVLVSHGDEVALIPPVQGG